MDHNVHTDAMPTATAAADLADLTPAPAPELVAFVVGSTYECRSFADYDCRWTFTVVKRTARFVTLVNAYNADDVHRVGVRVWNGVEACSPIGTYSMAPVLTAAKLVVAA